MLAIICLADSCRYQCKLVNGGHSGDRIGGHELLIVFGRGKLVIRRSVLLTVGERVKVVETVVKSQRMAKYNDRFTASRCTPRFAGFH